MEAKCYDVEGGFEIFPCMDFSVDDEVFFSIIGINVYIGFDIIGISFIIKIIVDCHLLL